MSFASLTALAFSAGLAEVTPRVCHVEFINCVDESSVNKLYTALTFLVKCYEVCI